MYFFDIAGFEERGRVAIKREGNCVGVTTNIFCGRREMAEAPRTQVRGVRGVVGAVGDLHGAR